MSIRTLGALARLILPFTFLLALAACGGSSRCVVAPGVPATTATADTADTVANLCHFGNPSTYLYATSTSNSLLAFQIDSNSGALTALPSTPGPANSSIANFHFLLMFSDPSTNSAYGFTVNSASGALEPTVGSPFSLGSPTGGPVSIWNPLGGYLYATEPDGTIVGFSGPGDGTLTAPVPGSPFAAGITPSQITSAGINTGVSVYVSDKDDPNGGILGYTADSMGTLTPISGSPFSTLPSAGPTFMQTVIGTTQSFVYVSLSQAGKVAAFAVDANTGSLTPVPGSPFTVGNTPGSITYDLINLHLFVLNTSDHTISVFNIDPGSGTLSAVAGSPFAAGTATGGMLYYPNYLLYVADTTASKILIFNINPNNGALSPAPASPVQVSDPPLQLTNVFFPLV